MQVSDFDFELPGHLIAQTAVEPRDAARLLVYDRADRSIRHRRIRDLVDELAAGDLLVVNDTRVLPHRLVGRRATGGRVEVLILERRDADCIGFVKPARKLHADESVELEAGRVTLHRVEMMAGGRCRFRLSTSGGDLDSVLEKVGRAPLPPYLRRPDEANPVVDRQRYQTVYAREPGAVAAPTAGLHFTPELLARLRCGGVDRASVTLHVGEGTFAPVRTASVEEHIMHRERFELDEHAAEAVRATRSRGGRIAAVGTTSARVLETCAREDRTVDAAFGETDLFLYPGRELRIVDVLLTNFHLPRSTLLMLVSALIGRDELLRVYGAAIAEGYRFYSFGDAMLVV